MSLSRVFWLLFATPSDLLLHIRSGASMPSRLKPRASTRRGQRAEREARLAGRVVGRAQHRATLVERGERRREIVEVTGEPVRLQRVRRLRGPRRRSRAARARARAPRAPRARPAPARWRPRRRPPSLCGKSSGFARARTAGTGRFALEREHPVPVEDVVLDAIAREVGVLHRADADLGRERRAARPHRASDRSSRPRRRRARSPRRAAPRASTVSPARVLNIFLSVPRIEPNATCSARAGGASQPASSPTANTIARCCVCGAPTT